MFLMFLSKKINIWDLLNSPLKTLGISVSFKKPLDHITKKEN